MDEVDWSCDSEKALVGFWLGKGKTMPEKSRSKWGREYADAPDCKVWNSLLKERIAAQVEKIRHRKVLRGDYSVAPDMEAHWFIDPTHAECGKRYTVNDVDFGHLSKWSSERMGFIQVCENEGANWLPFKPFRQVNTYHHINESGKRRAKFTREVIYEIYRNG